MDKRLPPLGIKPFHSFSYIGISPDILEEGIGGVETFSIRFMTC
ncbi:MAG: hypothetical protein NTY64_04930 [Deltaproteobacteria bacterium]|nr:hypothetical protein [Deltaproteobacteria bacterium]